MGNYRKSAYVTGSHLVFQNADKSLSQAAQSNTALSFPTKSDSRCVVLFVPLKATRLNLILPKNKVGLKHSKKVSHCLEESSMWNC